MPCIVMLVSLWALWFSLLQKYWHLSKTKIQGRVTYCENQKNWQYNSEIIYNQCREVLHPIFTNRKNFIIIFLRCIPPSIILNMMEQGKYCPLLDELHTWKAKKKWADYLLMPRKFKREYLNDREYSWNWWPNV